jgi:hypothetical protein
MRMRLSHSNINVTTQMRQHECSKLDSTQMRQHECSKLLACPPGVCRGGRLIDETKHADSHSMSREKVNSMSREKVSAKSARQTIEIRVRARLQTIHLGETKTHRPSAHTSRQRGCHSKAPYKHAHARVKLLTSMLMPRKTHYKHAQATVQRLTSNAAPYKLVKPSGRHHTQWQTKSKHQSRRKKNRRRSNMMLTDAPGTPCLVYRQETAQAATRRML